MNIGAGDEMEFMDLALNQIFQLPLGWHVLRNRAYKEMHFLADKRKKAEEEFFAHSS
jgi:hypothetical protein